MDADQKDRKYENLSDINPELNKLSPGIREEFNRRHREHPEAWHLLLRDSDCRQIIEAEEVRQKLVVEHGVKFEKNRLEKLAREKLAKTEPQHLFLKALDQLHEWKRFYKEEFCVEINLTDIELPKRKSGSGFDVLVVVAEGMTPERVFDKLSERFDTDKYIFDLNTIDSVRKPSRTYAIWLKPAWRAVKGFDSCDYLTIEERLLFELIYFKQTGQHLVSDLRVNDACYGSVDLGGCSPVIFWDKDKEILIVDWCGSIWMRDLELMCSGASKGAFF